MEKNGIIVSPPTNNPGGNSEPSKLNRLYPLLKYTLLLLFIYLIVGVLYYGRSLLVPMSFAALFSMLMLPISRRLESWGVHRGIATVLCILIILLTIAGMVTLFSAQVINFAQDLPALQKQLNQKLTSLQGFIETQTHIEPERQIQYVEEQVNSLLESTGRYVSNVLATMTGTLATFGIIAIYIFFFMFYRSRFKRFFLMISPEQEHTRVKLIINQISRVTQQYLTGVLTVIGILAVLNSTGLLIIGIRQAIFFGVLAGVLNIIPYIGSFVGGLLPVIMALLTRDTLGPAIAVAGVFAFNQFLENNFLTPNIVGGKVKVNPLATIIALLIGGALWGVAGMIMFIPFLGILKIIFDNIESLRPYGYLIGEEEYDQAPTGKQPKHEQIKEKVQHRVEKVKDWLHEKQKH